MCEELVSKPLKMPSNLYIFLSTNACLCCVNLAVSCVPFDPAACQSKIDVGFNRAVYSENFLKTLKKKARYQYERFSHIVPFDMKRIENCKTIGDFDDAFICTIYGFQDKFDYYRQCGSIGFIPKIRVPAFAINAVDDPFILASSLPKQEYVQDAPVRLIYHENGEAKLSISCIYFIC